MRRSVPLLAGPLAIALLLAGCSSSGSAPDSTPGSGTSPAASSTGCTPAASGSASDAVTVSAKKGTDPKATFTSPVAAPATTERTVVTAGTGKVVGNGAVATVEFALYDGADGRQLTSTGFDGSNQQQLVLDQSILPGLVKTIACSTVGSRIVGVLPPADTWGSAGNESLKVTATDSIVFVVDVDDIVTGAGEPIASMTGMPEVSFDSAGKPTITVPKSDPPTETRVGILTEGTGQVVPKGATVTVNYTGVVWASGETFDSSWDRGTPAQFTTTGVVPGFEKALDYQKVGSTLLVVVPPAEGYGANANGKIPANSTLVFVVNIVSIGG